MFRKASLKLTALYLSIIMLISLFFSVALYRLWVREFSGDLSRQTTYVRTLPGFYNDLDDFLSTRTQQISLVKRHILSDLIGINLVILIGGAFISYVLARKALDPIEKAHAAQSRFTADASHELRTPIAAMRSETEVALMDPKLTIRQAKHQLTSNLEELDKLTYLSENLLRLAQTDENSTIFQEFDPNKLVGTVIERYHAQATKKHITVIFEPARKLKFYGDLEMLGEALGTLVDNAIKYSPQKSTVRIKLDQTSNRQLISITDQGIGIRKADQEHIFERFYRADSARTKSGANGYGLGLSIAKQIVDLHHGEIAIKSQPQKGTTITIALPQKS